MDDDIVADGGNQDQPRRTARERGPEASVTCAARAT